MSQTVRLLLIATAALLTCGTAYMVWSGQAPLPAGLVEARRSFVNLTHGDPKENLRVYNISMLPIEWEKKQVLMRRQVFLGATPEHVRLALGEPAAVIPATSNRPETWAYEQPGRKDVILMEFQGGVLERVAE